MLPSLYLAGIVRFVPSSARGIGVLGACKIQVNVIPYPEKGFCLFYVYRTCSS